MIKGKKEPQDLMQVTIGAPSRRVVPVLQGVRFPMKEAKCKTEASLKGKRPSSSTWFLN